MDYESTALTAELRALVPREGLEPSRPYSQRILSPVRLPIPPSRLSDLQLDIHPASLDDLEDALLFLLYVPSAH